MRRGCSAVPDEACGVWLDTAELKRRPVQSLPAKPRALTRILERKHLSVLTQPRAAQPRTKQTTIHNFFSPQTDEKDKENCRPCFIPNKGCKDTAVPLADCPVKILALPRVEAAQEQPFGAEEEVQGTAQRWARAAPAAVPDSSGLQVESHSQSKASSGVGEDSCCFSLPQDSEDNQLIAHRNESQLFPGETVSGSGSVTSAWGITTQEGQEMKAGLGFQPGAKWNKKPQQTIGVSSVTDFADTEKISPVRAAKPWAAGGVCSPPHSPWRAQPLGEHSQNTAGARGSPCRQLFTQDSQGNRVIAHRDWDSSPRHLPHSPHRHSPHQPGGQQLELCPESLFTQDSQGNRVIKHW